GAHGKGHGANVLDHGYSFLSREPGGTLSAPGPWSLGCCSGLLQAAGSMQPPHTGATPFLHAVSRMLSQHLWVDQAFRSCLAFMQSAHAPGFSGGSERMACGFP